MTFTHLAAHVDPEEVEPDSSDSSESDASHSSSSNLRRGKGEQKTGSIGDTDGARKQSLDKLQGIGAKIVGSAPGGHDHDKGKAVDKGKATDDTVRLSWKKGTTEAAVRRRHRANGPDAVIVLKEEKVRYMLVYISLLLLPLPPRPARSTTFCTSSTRGTSHRCVCLGHSSSP